ncbi:hypothetical protein HPP92_004048 [Vanilla planifolia]|uniref:Uncharacterized protein n=1 Tax=Vanilla planifolia TaxID=51239 RepID=A0A835S4T3_VANPL|nr:hypothetical protein HPP92_004048 [Vanilla planifolia]
MQTLHSRRPDSSAGNRFSFSRPNSEHLEYDAWAETIKKTQNPFGRDGTDRKIGPWVRRNTAPNSFSNFGTSSPPLWRSTTQESLPNFSRTQLIAKYRQEMMDLVRGLDEPAHELLRDMEGVSGQDEAGGGGGAHGEERVVALDGEEGCEEERKRNDAEELFEKRKHGKRRVFTKTVHADGSGTEPEGNWRRCEGLA